MTGLSRALRPGVIAGPEQGIRRGAATALEGPALQQADRGLKRAQGRSRTVVPDHKAQEPGGRHAEFLFRRLADVPALAHARTLS
ncbi:MAG TPA: hypothetical protein VEH29_06195, partial [Acidimicrobiales bacterium]|nr:hypothetical protein [Acidimicrobiales bacterium]